MKKFLASIFVIGAVLAVCSTANAVIPNIVTCQVTQGTLGISWNGQVATATATGFSVGGGGGSFVYTWQNGASGATQDFSSLGAGAGVQVTLNIWCDGSVWWTGSASSTVPGGGGCQSNCGGGSAPTVNLTVASPNPQSAGATALVNISSSNASSCQISTQFAYNGPAPTNYSSYNIGSVNQTTTVTLTCSNTYGTSAPSTVTITVQSSGGSPPPSCPDNDCLTFGFPGLPVGQADSCILGTGISYVNGGYRSPILPYVAVTGSITCVGQDPLVEIDLSVCMLRGLSQAAVFGNFGTVVNCQEYVVEDGSMSIPQKRFTYQCYPQGGSFYYGAEASVIVTDHNFLTRTSGVHTSGALHPSPNCG